MKLKQYIVDAFAERIFSGNPAAVCLLDSWLPDGIMQAIVCENMLSETAFAVKEEEYWHLRWFTPGGEIDLCGHATLATAFVLFSTVEKDAKAVSFTTLGAILTVERKDEMLEMVFPAYELHEVAVDEKMVEALGARPVEAWMGRDLLCIFDSEETVISLKPDIDKVLALDGLLVHASARGISYDTVSRSFAPKCGVIEDPVCGSGHCHIAPYWAKRLGKARLACRQASERGGDLYCTVSGDRVYMAGRAVLFSSAEIDLSSAL